jgi:hypothetical protein
LGEDKCVFFVLVLLLLLVVGVVAEGCQRPPHNLGAWEALERGPCFVIGHAPLDSEGKLGCCHNAVVRAHPHAAVSASHANFAPDSSSCRGSEQRWFCGAHTCNLVVSKSSLLMLCCAWRRWLVSGVHGIFGSVLGRGFSSNSQSYGSPAKPAALASWPALASWLVNPSGVGNGALARW